MVFSYKKASPRQAILVGMYLKYIKMVLQDLEFNVPSN